MKNQEQKETIYQKYIDHIKAIKEEKYARGSNSYNYSILKQIDFSYLDYCLSMTGDSDRQTENVKKFAQQALVKNKILANDLEKYLKLGFLARKGCSVDDPIRFFFHADIIDTIYCSIPKNACSLFKYFIADNSRYKDKYDKLPLGKLHQNDGSLIATNLELLSDDNTFKFVVLRNPLRRLVSAYFNKIIFPVEGAAIQFVSQAQEYLNIKQDLDRTISFEEFIQYILIAKDYELDHHIRPQSNFLGSVIFDYYGQFEDIEQTISFLENKFNTIVRTKVAPPQHRTNYKDYDNKCYSIIGRELRYKPMPIAENMYNKNLQQKVIERFSKDVAIYQEKFKKNVAIV